MTSYIWNGGTGDWNSGNWVPAGNPTVGDSATIQAGGLVISELGNSDNLIASLSLDTTASFAIAFGNTGGAPVATSFTIEAGIVSGGAITVEDATSFYVGGTVSNAGTIFLDSSSAPAMASPAGDPTALVIDSPTVTLTGAGMLLMSDFANNQILGNNGTVGGTLINVDNSISGAGQFGIGGGANALAVTNQGSGVIDASQGVGLVIQLDANGLTNQGLVEATGTGGLVIQSTTVTNTGGTILASGTGDNVVLALNASIAGGTLESTGGGVIAVSRTDALDGTANTVTLTAGSTVQVGDAQQLDLLGAIDNEGTIAVSSTGDNTSLVLNSSTVTLSGGGQVVLSDNAGNQISGNSNFLGTLVNVDNAISGAGTITVGNGDFAMALTNDAAGVIDANQGTTLVIQLGTNVLANQGLIEATGSGGLLIESTTVTNTGGTILAAGDDVVLASNASVAGGTLESTGGGVIAVSRTDTLDGTANTVTITGGSVVQVGDAQQLDLLGTIDNAGAIYLQSTGDGTSIVIDSPTVTLTGGGQVNMSTNTGNQITGNGNFLGTLVNVDDVIFGAGTITVGNGDAAMALTNDAAGVINANQSTALVIQLGTNALLNAGQIVSTDTGGLVIQSTTVTNTGTILAAGAGNDVVLAANASIAGGTLETTGGGVIAIYRTDQLDGSTNAVTITNGSTVAVSDGQQLDLLGTIDNAGMIAVSSTGDSTAIVIDSPTVTLTGGGELALSDNASNQIIGNGSFLGTLVNADNTITGAGTITVGNGDNAMALTNDAGGVIDANQVAALYVYLQTNPLVNAGLMEATAAGGLVFQSTAVTNTGGTILAAGSGDFVALIGNAGIAGGTLETSGGGIVAIGQTDTLDGAANPVTVTTGSTVQVDDNAQLDLLGSFQNAGTIAVSSTGDTTSLVIASPTVTLAGGGRIALSDNAGNQIIGNNAGDTLVNVDNTIAGVGAIGNAGSALAVTNEAGGVIEAAGGSLLLGSPIDGTGTLATTTGATLALLNTSAFTVGDTMELTGGGAIAVDTALTTATAPLSVITAADGGGTLEFSNVLSGVAGITNATTLDVNMQVGGTETVVGFRFASAVAAASAMVVGNDIVVPCFAEGTLLLTDHGEAAVQTLHAGDRVVALSGRQTLLQPIRWIGHRRVDCRSHPRPHQVWPVRVQADAFGPGMPHRALLLSPDHAVFVAGALIPVRYLVNGRTIAQQPVDEVTYWHVELPRHDLLLAEGLRCESYLDTGNRADFARGRAVATTRPDRAAVLTRD